MSKESSRNPVHKMNGLLHDRLPRIIRHTLKSYQAVAYRKLAADDKAIIAQQQASKALLIHLELQLKMLKSFKDKDQPIEASNDQQDDISSLILMARRSLSDNNDNGDMNG